MKSSTYGASRGGPGWTGPHAPPSRREDVARVCSSYELSSKLTTDWPCAGPDNRHFTSSSLLIVFNRVFSVVVGLGILAYKTRRQPEFGSFSQRLKPASPYFACVARRPSPFSKRTCRSPLLRSTQLRLGRRLQLPVHVVPVPGAAVRVVHDAEPGKDEQDGARPRRRCARLEEEAHDPRVGRWRCHPRWVRPSLGCRTKRELTKGHTAARRTSSRPLLSLTAAMPPSRPTTSRSGTA